MQKETSTTTTPAPQLAISRLNTTPVQCGPPTSFLQMSMKRNRSPRSPALIHEGPGSHLELAPNLNLPKSLSGPVSQRTKLMLWFRWCGDVSKGKILLKFVIMTICAQSGMLALFFIQRASIISLNPIQYRSNTNRTTLEVLIFGRGHSGIGL